MIIKRLEELVRRHLKYLPAGEPLAPDRNLHECGLDSMATVDLMLDIEDEFAVAIPDDLLTDHTFGSLAALARVIEGLQVGLQAGHG